MDIVTTTQSQLLLKIVFSYKKYRFEGIIVMEESMHLIAKMDSGGKHINVSEFLESLGFVDCQEMFRSLTIERVLLGYHLSTHEIVFSCTFQSKYTMQLTNTKILLQSQQPLSLQSLPLIGTLFNQEDVFYLQDIALIKQQQMAFILHAHITIGKEMIPLVIDTSLQTLSAIVFASEKKETVQWVTINKGFSVITLNRVGFKMANQMMYVYIDASFAISFLSIDVIGLYLGTNFPTFTKFDGGLQGLSITYSSSVLTIGGSFVSRGNDYYEGSVLLSIQKLTFVALGIYQKEKDGKEHVFIHAMLSYPLGGPPCFYVTGIAIGVGVRYRLTMPQLHEVGTFPLIKSLTNKKKTNTSAILRQLESFLSPDNEAYFITIGLQFTTFGVVQTNAILNIEIKPKFNITLIGKSSFNFPDQLALVHATLHFRALYNQQEGVVKIEGSLQPDSYLFDKNCKLTGGFAVYMWFTGSHAHDFVITIGGYHPAFDVLQYPHYPSVSRVGINWQIDSHVSITGNGYFALTSSCLMAGGNLSLLYQSGRLKAWVIAYADFLIQWQPWHYDIAIGVSIGASYRVDFLFIHKTFTIELGASLHLWGPDFAGTARISWWIISFTISFGKPTEIIEEVGFDKVEDLLAPRLNVNAPQEYCKVDIIAGMIEKLSDVKYMVNSETLDIQFHCSVPIGTLNYFHNQDLITSFTGKPVHVLPMGEATPLFSTVSIWIESVEKVVGLELVKMEENVPFALWGDSKVEMPDAKMIEEVLTGTHLIGSTPVKSGILPVSGEYQSKQLYAPIVCHVNCYIDIKSCTIGKMYPDEAGEYSYICTCYQPESKMKAKIIDAFELPKEEIGNFALYQEIYHVKIVCKETGKR